MNAQVVPCMKAGCFNINWTGAVDVHRALVLFLVRSPSTLVLRSLFSRHSLVSVVPFSVSTSRSQNGRRKTSILVQSARAEYSVSPALGYQCSVRQKTFSQ